MNARMACLAVGVFFLAVSAPANSKTPGAALADIGYPTQDVSESPEVGLQDPYPALQNEKLGESPTLCQKDLTKKIRMEVLALPEGGSHQKVDLPLVIFSW